MGQWSEDMDVYGVTGAVCYWMYQEKKAPKWELKECYLIKDDYPLTSSKITGGCDRNEWDKWLYGGYEEEFDATGRLTIMWLPYIGSILLGMNVPVNGVVSPFFVDNIKKSQKWYQYIVDGGYLAEKSAKESILALINHSMYRNIPVSNF